MLVGMFVHNRCEGRSEMSPEHGRGRERAEDDDVWEEVWVREGAKAASVFSRLYS